MGATIVGRDGGFAEAVVVQDQFAFKLPQDMDLETAGPLFCGGATVFTPLYEFNIKPTAKVGVVGVGGLGHLAIQFASKWGCEVTAFTRPSSEKEKLVKELGAH